jgi:hypothetical protein
VADFERPFDEVHKPHDRIGAFVVVCLGLSWEEMERMVEGDLPAFSQLEKSVLCLRFAT